MKYYAVRNGKDGPKIYTSWEDCQGAVKGFKGAKFKKFEDENSATEFILKVDAPLSTYPEGHHIAVDASSSIKENFWEFQMVWTDTKELIYLSPRYTDGTNNTGEVLGLCHAIKYRENNKLNCNIYTDSMTAIAAVEKGSYNMKSNLISLESAALVITALYKIRTMDMDRIIHYNNKLIGIEIPADFNRK